MRCWFPSRLRPLMVALGLPLAGWAMGCGHGESGEPAGSEPCGVAAISFDAPLEGVVDRLDVEARLGSSFGLGESILSRSIETDGREPVEVPLPALEPGTRVTLSVAGYQGEDQLLRQVVSTVVQLRRTLLVRVRLNDECVPAMADRDVSCPGSTCRAGVCELPHVEPSDLDDYSPDWAVPPKGRCGPVDEGEPVVTLGQEGKTFVPLEEGQVLRPYRGLQGGMHFFYAVRMRGAHEVTAITHHFDKILSTGRESSVLTLEQPYQVDDDGCHRFDVPWILPPIEVVGETMRLGVTVSDATGNAGHGHVDIVVGEPIEP